MPSIIQVDSFAQRRYLGPDRRKPLVNVPRHHSISSNMKRWYWLDEVVLWIEVLNKLYEWVIGGCK